MDMEQALEIESMYTALPNADEIAHVLAAEVRRLHTWDGLMSLLDEHYPADVPLGPDSDPGPRILRLTREVHLLKLVADQLRAERDTWQASAREWESYAKRRDGELDALRPPATDGGT